MPGSAEPNLYIVITDFNGYTQTKACLTALRNSRFKSFQVIVVDHGTTVETHEGLSQQFPEVTQLKESPEKWWAGASNAGIHLALNQGANIIMLLNNDCFVETDTLDELVQLHVMQPEAIIAPIQRDAKTGAIITIRPRHCLLLGFPTLIGSQKLTAAQTAKRIIHTRLIAGGRGAMIPTSIFQRIGYFDEVELPHYLADHDFYLRAQETGIRMYIATQAIVEIDSKRTTVANNPEHLNFNQFVKSLQSTRSHRNLAHVSALFKKHYPIKHLYGLGVALYLVRYFAVYLIRRFWFLVRRCRTELIMNQIVGLEHQYEGMPASKVLDKIYTDGTWGKDENGVTTSGSGSHSSAVINPYIEAVSDLLKKYNFETIVDLGCGDFNVGRNFVSYCQNYIACDISSVIIERNKEKYNYNNVVFMEIDLSEDDLPKGDIGFVQQALQHLSNNEIVKFVANVNSTKPFRYLLVTEHLPSAVNFEPNLDKATGPNSRVGLDSGIELHKEPFGLEFKSLKVLCEVIESTGGKDGIIRSTLFEL